MSKARAVAVCRHWVYSIQLIWLKDALAWRNREQAGARPATSAACESRFL